MKRIIILLLAIGMIACKKDEEIIVSPEAQRTTNPNSVEGGEWVYIGFQIDNYKMEYHTIYEKTVVFTDSTQSTYADGEHRHTYRFTWQTNDERTDKSDTRIYIEEPTGNNYYDLKVQNDTMKLRVYNRFDKGYDLFVRR